MNLWRTGARLWRYEPRTAAPGTVLWIAFHTTPFFVGLLLQAIFDSVAPHPARLDAYTLIVVFVAAETVRLACFFFAWVVWMRAWQVMVALLRTNLLRSAMTGPGPASTRLPNSASEVITRFRDDVDDVVWFVDVHLDVAGGAVFTALALAVMAHIDARLTLVTLVPLLAVGVGNQLLTNRMRSLRRRYRESTAATTAFLGEVFGSDLAIKTGSAEPSILRHLAELNTTRNRAAIRDNVGRESLLAFNGATIDVAVGVMLVVAASSVRHGSFTVGDLVLFTTYIDGLAALPRRVGRLLAYRRHAQVSMERLAPMVGGNVDALSSQQPIHLRESPPPRSLPDDVIEPLTSLSIEGLTALHAESSRGVEGIDLELSAGTLTVIAGQIGSGKSTLIRALLGLMPLDAGTIRWNDRVVTDPSVFLVPPRVAYVPQVPVLFSEELGDNIQLGLPAAPDQVQHALWLAVMENDLSCMPSGLQTLLGPRGVRLSGGQQQRVASSRAFAQPAQLFVIDDPSSALDAATEELMWDRLFSDGLATYLIVSNRPEVLDRADQVLLLVDGRVTQPVRRLSAEPGER